MSSKRYSRYITLFLFAILLFLSWKIIEPFFWTIISAIMVAYVFYPVFKWLKKKTGHEMISALTVIFMVFMIISVPVALLMVSLINEVQEGIDYVKVEFSDGNLLSLSCQGKEHIFCKKYILFTERFPDFDLKSSLISLGISLKDTALKTLDYFSSSVLNFFILLYIVFFLLVDGKRFLKAILSSLNLKKKDENGIIKIIEDITYAVIFGSIITAIMQGILAALGYWLIGNLSNAALLGLLTAFFALIPYLGTSIVWLPVSAYLFFMGLMTGSAAYMFRGVGLFLFCALIVSTIDNILKPKLIGDRASLHPALVFLGIIGGLKFIGFMGIVIGPLILAMFIKFMNIAIVKRKNP